MIRNEKREIVHSRFSCRLKNERRQLVLADLDLLLAADLHIDPAWLDLLGLGDVEPQDAVIDLSLDAIAFNSRGQGDRPLERSIAPLDAMVIALLVLGLLAHLALDCQDVVLERDLEIFGLQARNRQLNKVAIGCLAQIKR